MKTIYIVMVIAILAASVFIAKDYLAMPVYGISYETGECVYQLEKGDKVSCPKELEKRHIKEWVK